MRDGRSSRSAREAAVADTCILSLDWMTLARSINLPLMSGTSGIRPYRYSKEASGEYSAQRLRAR